MIASTPDSRPCPQCGGLNFGGLPRCIICGAAMTAPATGAERPVAFCGECGAELEPGLKFCGECGTPIAGMPERAPGSSQATRPVPKEHPPDPIKPASVPRSSASRWAPPPVTSAPATVPNASSQTQQKKRFCRGCGAELKAGAKFCRKCGAGVDRAAAMPRPLAPKPIPAPKPVATAKQAVPAPPPPPPAPVATKKQSTGDGLGKKILRVVVPVASMVVTYFLTNKVLGPMLAQQFGDASRQMVPVLVSMAVGSVARQLTK